MTKEISRLLLTEQGGYFFFIAMIEYKTIIRIIIMYSIGNAPFRGQNLTAYRLRFALHEVIISAPDRFCNNQKLI
nr:MAG TPA: hypothetical protein [Caudoviricetes sp.]